MWIDADDIPSGARWRQELGSAIEAADAFVFVITPASVASAECQTELARAVEVGKRLVPVLYQETAGAPPELLTYQYVDARDGTGFDVTVDKVIAAIDTDHDWVTAHTLWLGRALRWEESGRDRSTLLRRGKELRSAEEWLAGQSEHRKPPPTALQSAYIAESGRAERRRMRRLATAACIAVAVAVTLAVLALLQRSEAIAQRDEARSRELAAKSGQALEVDPELGILLALEALDTDRTAEGVDALRRAVNESRVRDVLGSHAGGVTTIAFSPDGSLIVTGGEDGSARISRSDDGSEVAALDAHDAPVRITTFDPSGERVLTAADDGTMRLWDAATGAMVGELAGHTDRVQTAEFSPEWPPAPHLRRHHRAPVGHFHRAFAARPGRRRVRPGVRRVPARWRTGHDGQLRQRRPDLGPRVGHEPPPRRCRSTARLRRADRRRHAGGHGGLGRGFLRHHRLGRADGG